MSLRGMNAYLQKIKENLIIMHIFETWFNVVAKKKYWATNGTLKIHFILSYNETVIPFFGNAIKSANVPSIQSIKIIPFNNLHIIENRYPS